MFNNIQERLLTLNLYQINGFKIVYKMKKEFVWHFFLSVNGNRNENAPFQKL